jgi:hypothetical protein
MPHFCGRTHSTRDRRLATVSDEPRPRAGDATTPLSVSPISVPVNSTLSPAIHPEDAAGIPVPTRTFAEPSHEQIAALAYSYWEARGCQGGSPEADWLRAQEELRGR